MRLTTSEFWAMNNPVRRYRQKRMGSDFRLGCVGPAGGRSEFRSKSQLVGWQGCLLHRGRDHCVTEGGCSSPAFYWQHNGLVAGVHIDG